MKGVINMGTSKNITAAAILAEESFFDIRQTKYKDTMVKATENNFIPTAPKAAKIK